MTVTRKGHFIVGDRSCHSARLNTGRFDEREGSCLPGCWMDYDDARMAMTIADSAGPEHMDVNLYVWIKRET